MPPAPSSVNSALRSPRHARLRAAGAGGSGLVRRELASRYLLSPQAQASGAGDADPGWAGGRTAVQAAHPQCWRVAEGCRASNGAQTAGERSPTPPAPAPRAQASLAAGPSLLQKHLLLRPLLRRLRDAVGSTSGPTQGSRDGDRTRQAGLGPGPAPQNRQGGDLAPGS